MTLDEEYRHLHPHAFHLQLPRHHKTEGGIPYATIDAHRKARAIIKLSKSLVLKEVFFVNHDYEDTEDAADVGTEEEKDGVVEDSLVDDDEEVMDDEDVHQESTSLHQLSLQCQRLYSQLSTLSKLHYYCGGISQSEICDMILTVLRLLCATVEIIDEDDSTRKVIIHYDNVGHILERSGDTSSMMLEQLTFNNNEASTSLLHPFALPSTARQSLLSVALDLVRIKKDRLRGVSNSALFISSSKNDNGSGGGGGDGSSSIAHRQQLLLSHQALLRMLLRTAPYLNEHEVDLPPKEANGMRSSILKKSVNLIRSCRRFFDQGNIGEGGGGEENRDKTARLLWSSLRKDLEYRSHSNSTFRALILLYLFHPSKCSSAYYLEVLPLWMECWRNIDRCPDWDNLWMVLFSRARKYVPLTNDVAVNIWSTLRKHLLASCKYWLQVPVGGVSADKSFPNAAAPGTRSFPVRVKVFTGGESRYEEGINFVGKLSKLLMFCTAAPTADIAISEGTADILRFLSFIKPYYNPSNSGAWTFPLGAFLHYLSYSLCERVGVMAGWKVLQRDHSDVATMLLSEEPYLNSINLTSNEIVALLDVMLPLCQQALYSKNPSVSHCGETALLYLVQIDPMRVTPPLLDFALRALDVSAVNLAHQAPAALSMLSKLLQPALRARPDILLSRLPEILQLSLAGIDSNDQNKTLRTMIFYRTLVTWVPVGGPCLIPSDVDNSKSSVLDQDGNDGTIQVGNQLMDTRYSFVNLDDYKTAIAALPRSSVLVHQEQDRDEEENPMLQENIRHDAMSAMTDWSLMFLDRVYELLRATGEQEKLGKGQGGTGMLHTSSDVQTTKNFSRIMKETLIYFFSAMDDSTYSAALRSVTRFLQEETLPFAAKDAGLLCQALCSTRFATEVNDYGGMDTNPGFDALVPILTENLNHKSSKCVIYRLRCLAGAIRYAGSTVLKHREAVSSAIAFALSSSNDRVIFKTGCKLLRHTLSSQCEEYPIAQCYHPMRLGKSEDQHQSILGMSALLRGDKILWHVPNGKQLAFSVGLLSQFALKRWIELGSPCVGDESNVNLQQWRQSLRVMRYTLRGCSGILLDEEPEVILSQTEKTFSPREVAAAKLMLSMSDESRNALRSLRPELCLSLLNAMRLIARDTMDCESKMNGDNSETSGVQYTKNETGSLSNDYKIVTEVIQLSELLLARRGAQYQSSKAKTIYRGQKEILTDFALASEADFLHSALARCNDDLHTGTNRSTYKDGEDSGKTVSRALLVCRIHLSNQDLIANASTQIPRRLRKLRGDAGSESHASVFSLNITLQALQESFGSSYAINDHSPLEVYEAFFDGLCGLACHPNINVRSDAHTIVDFALTRLGWIATHNNRPARLLNAITLNDTDQNGLHGIPCCSQLVNQVNSQGKRSRLAECVKGVAMIVAMPRILKHFRWEAANRLELVKMLCGTKKLLQLLPQEECPKFLHYVNSIFLSYRSMLFSLQRSTKKDQTTHEACLLFLLGILQEGSGAIDTSIDNNDSGAMHWRDRLVAAWFVLMFIDERDLIVGDPMIITQIWSMCFSIIEEEVGQPLQRVIIGLLGKLVSLSNLLSKKSLKCPELCTVMSNEKFCHAFSNALVFDHREDTSVSGGHAAQWSTGIEEIIRDATYNLAGRMLFPFNRISIKSVTFKIQHSQLIEGILLAIGNDNVKVTCIFLLDKARELVSSPPSEDQRNQQCTAAEIFAGCAKALLHYCISQDERDVIWETILLPFLEESVVKMPTNILGAFYDGCRYIIQHTPPSNFFPLLKWSISKVQSTLWQHEEDVEDSSGNGSAMADRFALQGKWMLVVQAVLVDIDCVDQQPFYAAILNVESTSATSEINLSQSLKHVNDILTPCLLNAIGHPYDKCRDHIASCLYRICNCYRNYSKALGNDARSTENPEIQMMKRLTSISDSDRYSFKERVRALATLRKFVSCCVHWGDAKNEYSQFIIPLLPIAFLSLQTAEGQVTPEDRVLEAELVKGYRYAIADVSSSCIANYGVSQDITRVLDVLKVMACHEYWQIRQASAHFLRNFQGAHKFLFGKEQEELSLSIAISLLADDRREVSSAATSTLTGILAMLPQATLEELVSKYISIANKVRCWSLPLRHMIIMMTSHLSLCFRFEPLVSQEENTQKRFTGGYNVNRRKQKDSSY